MYGSVFFLYGVALWYGSKLERDAYSDDPSCHDDPSQQSCFSGGKTMIVRVPNARIAVPAWVVHASVARLCF